jgi:hypothetical protein
VIIAGVCVQDRATLAPTLDDKHRQELLHSSAAYAKARPAFGHAIAVAQRAAETDEEIRARHGLHGADDSAQCCAPRLAVESPSADRRRARRGGRGLAGLGIICQECKGELQDMTGHGEQPGWALCRCAGAYWERQLDGSYRRVEGKQPS